MLCLYSDPNLCITFCKQNKKKRKKKELEEKKRELEVKLEKNGLDAVLEQRESK